MLSMTAGGTPSRMRGAPCQPTTCFVSNARTEFGIAQAFPPTQERQIHSLILERHRPALFACSARTWREQSTLKGTRWAPGHLSCHFVWCGALRPYPALALDVEDSWQTANTHAGVLTDVWIEGHYDPW